MSKDPAFLFYPGDWLGGTQLFNRAHKGAYMDLLMAQYANGPLHINDIAALLGSDFDSMWESKLKPKFKIDSNGLYFNEKLAKTMEDRKKFTASRIENLKGKKEKKSPHMGNHMDTHTDSRMENVNENRDSIINGSEKRKGGAGEKQKLTDLIPESWNGVAFDDLWRDYKAMRVKIKKPLTDRGERENLKDLIKLSGGDWFKAEMIALNSIKAGWQGFFAPKENKHEPEGGRYAHERKTIFDKA